MITKAQRDEMRKWNESQIHVCDFSRLLDALDEAEEAVRESTVLNLAEAQLISRLRRKEAELGRDLVWNGVDNFLGALNLLLTIANAADAANAGKESA